MRFVGLAVVAAFSLMFASCGSSGGGGEEESTEAVVLEETITKAFEEYFGVEGNLWKPRSDDHSSSPGNLVVLLSSKYTTRFDTCEIPLNDGTTAQLLCIDTESWTHTPYSCFSNGGRQTWRASFGCSKAARIEVVCRDSDKEVVFTVPFGQEGRICERFG